jgi:hypothetical protein
MPVDHHYHYLYTNKQFTITDVPYYSNLFHRILSAFGFYSDQNRSEIIPLRIPKQVLTGIQIEGEDIRQVALKIGDEVLHQIDVPKQTTMIPRYVPGFEIPFAYLGDRCKSPVYLCITKNYGTSVKVEEFWRDMTPEEEDRVEWIVQGKDEYTDLIQCDGDVRKICISRGLVLLE